MKFYDDLTLHFLFQVLQQQTRQYRSIKDESTGLETSVLGINVMVSHSHFNKGKLKVCLFFNLNSWILFLNFKKFLFWESNLTQNSRSVHPPSKQLNKFLRPIFPFCIQITTLVPLLTDCKLSLACPNSTERTLIEMVIKTRKVKLINYKF